MPSMAPVWLVNLISLGATVKFLIFLLILFSFFVYCSNCCHLFLKYICTTDTDLSLTQVTIPTNHPTFPHLTVREGLTSPCTFISFDTNVMKPFESVWQPLTVQLLQILQRALVGSMKLVIRVPISMTSDISVDLSLCLHPVIGLPAQPSLLTMPEQSQKQSRSPQLCTSKQQCGVVMLNITF